MSDVRSDRPALLVINMVKDHFEEHKRLAITQFAKQLIGPLNNLMGVFRKEGWPVVFSNDAFHEGDLIWKGQMKHHPFAEAQSVDLIDGLDHQPGDHWLPKPKFSAFFKTGLDEWLKSQGVTLCAVGGITTEFCVFMTVADAVCYDFKAVLLEDCSASWSEKVHEQVLGFCRRSPLYPLSKVAKSTELASELGAQHSVTQ